MAGPLTGITVVEITSIVLGPYACQTLGDLGADVIKIEPLTGDTNRNLGPHRHTASMSSMFIACNRNKRSIALDLKSEQGLAAALKIIAQADVLVHNFRPSAMRRLGLDYDSLQAINSKLIYCATYGYSMKGPYGERGALDDAIQAASGIADLSTRTAGEPRYFPTVLADKATAMNVVQATLAALFHRERSGEGQAIEVPMFESMVAFVMVEHLWGQTFEPHLGGAGYPRVLSRHRRPYQTKDGLYIALLPYWDAHWEAFCRLSGHPELLVDERFMSMRARLKNIDEAYRLTGEITAEKNRADWLALLQDSNVPHMPVSTLDELIDDPQLQASGFWQQLDHPTEGTLRMTGSPFGFSKTPTSLRYAPPHLGEHTRSVLSEVGMTAAEIDTMIAAGEALASE